MFSKRRVKALSKIVADGILIMPQTSLKLGGHIALGLSVYSSVHHTFFMSKIPQKLFELEPQSLVSLLGMIRKSPD